MKRTDTAIKLVLLALALAAVVSLAAIRPAACRAAGPEIPALCAD